MTSEANVRPMKLQDLIEALIALEKRHGGEAETNVQAVCMSPGGVHLATEASKPLPDVDDELLEGVRL